MTAARLDANSCLKTLTAAGMPEAQAEAVFKIFTAICDHNKSRPRNSDSLAARIAVAEIKAELMKWLADAVCAASTLCNAIVVFGTLVHIGVSLHHSGSFEAGSVSV